MVDPRATCRALSNTSFSLSVTGLYTTNTDSFDYAADGKWTIDVYTKKGYLQTVATHVTSSTYSATVTLTSGYTVSDVYEIATTWNADRESWTKRSYTVISMNYTPPIPTPTVPSSISYSSSINAYYSTSISWGTSSVEGGGSITYTLERSTNGGGYSQIYSGSGTSYSDRLSSSTTSVVYRVKATSGSASSGYKTGSTATVRYTVPKTVSTPGSISYSSNINAAKSTSISWGASTTNTGSTINYTLERAINGTGSYTQIYSGTNTSYSDSGLSSSVTSVIYRVKASASTVTSGYRTGTSATVYYNVAPGIPASISVPSSVKVGKTLSVSWGVASDTNLSGYILERSANGGSYTQVYKGANRSFTDTAVNGWNTIVYRVKGYDSYNEMSGYKTSSTVTVTYNTEPVISGSDGSLGTKTGAFSLNYTITDPDAGQVLTVVEKIDGKQKRTFTATSGVSNTFQVTAAEWLAILNGNHTIVITVNDGQGGTATRTYTFTKNETEIEMTLKAPLAAAERITRCILEIKRQIPTGAVFTVEICNNGFDSSPAWEDVTQGVIEGRKLYFSNQTKTAANWGLNVRAKVKRNGAAGNCYIEGIGGNYD